MFSLSKPLYRILYYCIDSKMSLLPKNIYNNLDVSREENIKARDNLFNELLNDPEFAEAVRELNALGGEQKKERRKRTSNQDRTFKFTGYIPLERRKSLRLQDKPPVYTEEHLLDEEDRNFHWKRKITDDDLDNIENIVYKPKRKRMSLKKTEPRFIIPVEDITDYMISQIATRVVQKKYSESGTSCHQCRQKTLDQKTICRNTECVGVRGQFCGVCLTNRYGEDAAVALKDPNWFCPVCREICNCSFCRARAGKRPTGILAPMALQHGHKSVKDFLDSLKGEGDYVEDHKNPTNVLGFTKDGHFACMGGGQKLEMHSPDIQGLVEVRQAMERDLRAIVNPKRAFYGFTKAERELS